MPLAGALVVLHHMTDRSAGPVDSMPSSPTGRYRFVRPDGDTAGRFVAAVRHDGVAYVSGDAVFRGPVGRIASLTVSDTSSSTPLTLVQRHVLVRGIETDGSRAVLELLVIRNPGDRTRVASGDGATWRTRLADGAIEALVPNSQGEVGVEATQVMGDTLLVSAPVPPGDRQLVVSYVLPAARRLVLHAEQGVNEFVVMLADTVAALGGGPLAPTGVRLFEGERYLRLEGKDVAPGDSLVVGFSPPPVRPADLWWLIVVASAGTLAAAALRWWRGGASRLAPRDEHS